MDTTFPAESDKVIVQVPKNIYAYIWWRRLTFTPFRIIGLFFLAALAVFLISLGDIFLRWIGIANLILIALNPLRIYIVCKRTVSNNPNLTDLKTVEFTPTRLISTGPDWKLEYSWSHFTRFSENSDYFLLDMNRSCICSIFPKSAFTPDQQNRFRQYALAKKDA